MPPRVATYYPTSSYSLPWPAAACHRPPPRAYVENKAVMSGEPVMPANWQRLAEAGGRPELDLALSGRIKAVGRFGHSLWAVGGSEASGRRLSTCSVTGSWRVRRQAEARRSGRRAARR